MFGLRLLPQREIDRVAFLLLPVQFARGVEHIVDVAVREDAVPMVFVIFRDIEVDRPFAFVCISVLQNLLYQCDLFDDMSRGIRLDAR